MNCAECGKIKDKKHLIYEDDLVAAILLSKPTTGGHVALMPKEHYAIIENIPDEVFGHMMVIANKISTACFEVLGAHGTNILVNNGIAGNQKTGHSTINIIPRVENDGLNLQWQPIKFSEDVLSSVKMTLEQETKEEPKEDIKEVKNEEPEEIPEEENYMLKQLERIP